MKRLIIIASCFLLLSCGNRSKDRVMICGSPNAYAYHSHKCKGLSRCGSEVSKMSLSEAKEKGYRACGFCYGKEK